MVLSVNHSASAWSTYAALTRHQGQIGLASARLSSEFRINSAADDAAGLAISEGLRSVVGGTRMAIRNSQDGIGLLRSAEGALGSAQAIVQRMRDLAVQRGNADVLGQDATAAIDSELASLKAEAGRILHGASWGSGSLLDGAALTLHVGPAADDSLTVLVPGMAALQGFFQAPAADGPAAPPAADPVLTATYTEATRTSASSQRIADLDLRDAASFDRLNGTVTYQGASLDLATVSFAAGTDASTRLGTLQTALDSALGAGSVSVSAAGADALLTGRDVAANNSQGAKDAVAVGFVSASATPPSGETNPPLASTYRQASRTSVSSQTISGLDLTDATSFDRLNGTIGYQGATLDLYSVEFGADDDAATRLETLQRALNSALGIGAVTVTAASGDAVFAGRDTAANNSGAARDAVAVTFAEASTPTPVKNAEEPESPGDRVDEGSLIDQLDEVLGLMSGARSYLGAVENRLGFTVNRLQTSLESTLAADSRIRDADQAYEAMRLTTSRLRADAAAAMLAQAVRAPEQLLSLLR